MTAGADVSRLLCSLEELQATGCREFRLGGGNWPLRGFVVQAPEGVRAYVNRCAHMKLPLNYLPDQFLTYDGSALLCYVHGAIYRKHDGYCIAGPCSGQSLATVPIEVVGNQVLLAAGVDAEEFAERYA
jgi:nitrite reductase/ring-hydroxylating ferredoxin subunit